MPLSHPLKEAILAQCKAHVEQRISMYQKAIQEAQEAANTEEKSSAGDKYETTRAMMQIERDQHARQLSETLQLKKVLDQINPMQTIDPIGLGSLVQTDKGLFFLAVSIGKLSIEKTECTVLSPTAPLAKVFLQQRIHATITFNGQHFLIQEIL